MSKELTGLEFDPEDIDNHVLFLHGKESTPYGSKYGTLHENFSVDSPDFQGMGIWERLEKIENLTEGMSDLVVVGSSYGGLLAGLLYNRHPDRIKGYVLMAPAFNYEEAGEIDKVPEQAFVIHGSNDSVVPIDEVAQFCEERGLPFIEVEDEHRLRQSHDLMVDKVNQILNKQAK